MNALKAVLTSGDLVAVLGRELRVRLLDISGSGCLLESASRLDPGTTGTLRLVYDGNEFVDDIRVTRCRACEGSTSEYRIGVEFLWTTAPTDRSLRGVLSRLRRSSIRKGPVTSAGGM